MDTAEKIQRLRTGRFAALTAYDYPSARIIDECGVDLILVGDSLGMVFAGQPDTTSVSIDQMVYHTTVVRRGVHRALLVADLPFGTYDTPDLALSNARRLADAGADAVKLEGGLAVREQVEALTRAGYPLLGHIGMLPQKVLDEGGYRRKGKSPEQASALLEDARFLEEAGAFAIVLESIVAPVAKQITRTTRIPTIGIGSGPACDGQIAVVHDIVGMYPWFVPPFIRPRANLSGIMREAIAAHVRDVTGSP